MRRHPNALGLAVVLLCAAPAAAQMVNPADAQKPESALQDTTAAVVDQHWQRLRSWEMPGETVVVGQELPLFEEERIGSYNQPRWTAKRLFPTTRIYVVPEGKVEFEHWTRVKTPRDGKTTVETQYEVEFGLPHRFQIDLYYVTDKTGSEGDLEVAEQKFEVRHALADWGEVPLNPTLYFEWVERDAEPDKFELKLLLGDELAPRWHWGTNLVYEHEISGALESEYELTAGISRTIRDSKLALGAEMKAALVDVHDDRGDFSEELEIGPSLRWQPLPAFHLDLAPLIGIGPDSRSSDVFVVLGWEF